VHASSLVPQISFDAVGTRTLRYTAAAAVTAQWVSAQDLLQNTIMNVNGAMSNYCVYSAVRVRRIDVYDISGSSDVAVSTTTVAWASLQGPSRVISSTGTPMYPGIVSSSPPAKSLAGEWINRGYTALGTGIVQLTIPIGSVVDLTFDYLLQSGYSQNSLVLNTAAGGSIGLIYFPPLDWSAGTKNLKAVIQSLT